MRINNMNKLKLTLALLLTLTSAACVNLDVVKQYFDEREAKKESEKIEEQQKQEQQEVEPGQPPVVEEEKPLSQNIPSSLNFETGDRHASRNEDCFSQIGDMPATFKISRFTKDDAAWDDSPLWKQGNFEHTYTIIAFKDGDYLGGALASHARNGKISDRHYGKATHAIVLHLKDRKTVLARSEWTEVK